MGNTCTTCTRRTLPRCVLVCCLLSGLWLSMNICFISHGGVESAVGWKRLRKGIHWWLLIFGIYPEGWEIVVRVLTDVSTLSACSCTLCRFAEYSALTSEPACGRSVSSTRLKGDGKAIGRAFAPIGARADCLMRKPLESELHIPSGYLLLKQIRLLSLRYYEHRRAYS